MTNDESTTHRLFFALWPDNAVRRQLASLQRQLPKKAGRPVPAGNLHITLHFLGAQSDEAMSCVREAARSVIAGTFGIQLDIFGYFRKAGIFWLGCRDTPEELNHLYRSLGDALIPCKYEPEARPYRPHITLLRKNHSPIVPFPEASISWQVEDFVLVESVSTPEGVRYEVLERYSLKSEV